MFNGKKLGAQRYKDESKAVNFEGTDRVKNLIFAPDFNTRGLFRKGLSAPRD